MLDQPFNDLDLTVIEMPIEFENDLPVYQGFIREMPTLTARAASRTLMYRLLMEQYDEYRQNLGTFEEEKDIEITSSLLTTEQLLKYYDGETFDGFSFDYL